MPTPDFPTDIDATDHSGLTADDHERFHDGLHGVYNTPAIGQTKTASYTLVYADANEVIEFDATAATTLTVPDNATVPFPIGTIIGVYQHNTGAVTIDPAAGVGILSPDGVLGARQLSGRYAEASLRKRAVDGWVLAGSLL